MKTKKIGGFLAKKMMTLREMFVYTERRIVCYFPAKQMTISSIGVQLCNESKPVAYGNSPVALVYSLLN